MDKILEQALLYDFYGELLTAHQKEIYEQFVLDDLSLGEIAADVPVRGQGAAAPAAKQSHQGRKFIFSTREGKATIAGTGIADGEVIAASCV